MISRKDIMGAAKKALSGLSRVALAVGVFLLVAFASIVCYLAGLNIVRWLLQT